MSLTVLLKFGQLTHDASGASVQTAVAVTVSSQFPEVRLTSN